MADQRGQGKAWFVTRADSWAELQLKGLHQFDGLTVEVPGGETVIVVCNLGSEHQQEEIAGGPRKCNATLTEGQLDPRDGEFKVGCYLEIQVGSCIPGLVRAPIIGPGFTDRLQYIGQDKQV